MAKKGRKPNLPQETLARARRELYGPAATEETVVQTETKKAEALAPAPKPIPRKPGTPRVADLRQEYAYVLSDLQNMGILAAVMMLVLVIMSFFI
jgi:hypothetical protein